jgi:hypothetical protein
VLFTKSPKQPGVLQKQHLFGGQSCISRHLFGDAQVFAYTFSFSFYFPITTRSKERFNTQHGISHIRKVLEGQGLAKLGTKESTLGGRLKIRICIQDCFDMKEKKLYLLDTKKGIHDGIKEVLDHSLFWNAKATNEEWNC